MGRLVVYFEIDSWIPHDLAPFLTQDGHYPKVFNGVEGQRLKTKKMKGCLSQGLILPIPAEFYDVTQFEEGIDVTEALDIQKWERPLTPELRGLMKGDFPSFIPKTDQERIQNLSKHIDSYIGEAFEVTEKLHGSSMTVYLWPDDEGKYEFNVCSRNVNLKPSDTNTFWKTASDLKLQEVLHSLLTHTGKLYALQGELIGEGINGNIYNIKGHSFKLFDIYDISSGCYLNPSDRKHLWMIYGPMDSHVPILENCLIFDHTIKDLLEGVEHKSTLCEKAWAEGWVFKNKSKDLSFKVISNKFLMKYDE